MKGTLPRRADPDADAAAAASLRRDPKSRAENVMIVDLLRHDLGRVALPGSVVVDDLLAVEAYRTGWQMTSTVRGVAGRLGVGGGILIDSDADAEWAEVAAKGRFPTHPAPPLGLFETMRWEGGTLQRWPRHRARMAAGAAAWGLPFDGEAAEATALAAVREALAGDPAAVRGPLRVRLDLREDGRLSARARPHPADDASETVVVWSDRPIDADDPARRHKGLDRRAYDEANAWARAHGVADVLFCNRDGRLAEGAISNVFVLDRDGRWRTPPINDGALPGVLRGDLLDAGLAVEAPLRPADLQGATVAIGNALRGLRPVRIDPVRRWRPT